jgi:hypothetical protein
VEKRPNKYVDTHIQKLDEFELLPMLDESDVYIDIVERFSVRAGEDLFRLYTDYDANRVLQAKAYAWAREYQKYFPNEMTVFYEDEEIIVFNIRQNPYALNNFAIPYAGN